MSQGAYSPAAIRSAVQEALAGALPTGAQQGPRPVQPTKAHRAGHDKSYSVVVSAVANDAVRTPDPGGTRAVVYNVTIELVKRAPTPGRYDSALTDLYGFADEVFQVMMGEIGAGGDFQCISFEFESMSKPTQSDAEYGLELVFNAEACWPVN